MDIEERGSGGTTFASRGEYERLLTQNYPAASLAIVERMALHGLREREDGRFELKTDPFYFSGRAGGTVEAMQKRERELTNRLWAALEGVSCPTLVIRGAASDFKITWSGWNSMRLRPRPSRKTDFP